MYADEVLTLQATLRRSHSDRHEFAAVSKRSTMQPLVSVRKRSSRRFR